MNTRTSQPSAQIVRLLLGLTVAAGLFLAITYLGWYRKPLRIQHLMVFTILTGTACLYALRHRLKSVAFVSAAILFAGLVMRFGYALYTPTTLRFHDLAPIDIQATGHAGYVLNLFINGTLPPDNSFQFAQPPLYYLLAAYAMKVYQGVTGITNPVELFEAARLPSLFASCGALLLSYRIGQALKIRGSAFYCLLALCAFLPNHFLLAGRANPDSLAVFFIYLIALYALRWQREQRMSDILWLAAGFGLGMMTKMTVAVLAFPVGLMMAVIGWRRCIRGKEWRLLRQYGLFLIIAAALGLWHPIRNAILYAQPLGFVHEMALTDPQYVGNLSLWHRFGIPNARTFVAPLYLNIPNSNNIILYTLKTSVFGEFSYAMDPIVPYLLLFSNTLLVLFSLACTVWAAIVSLRTRQPQILLLLGMWVCMLGAYLFFNVRYPFCCSMDYRYMVGTSLVGSVLLGMSFQAASGNALPARAYRILLAATCLVFSVSAVVMYTAIA